MTILLGMRDRLLTDSFTVISSPHSVNMCGYGEKVYKDPLNRFIIAMTGDQLWLRERVFHRWANKVIPLVIRLEQQGIKTLENGPEIKPAVKGFIVTKKGVYDLSKLPTVNHVREPIVHGMNSSVFPLLLAAGYDHRTAYTMISNFGRGTGGTIYEYKCEDLEPLEDTRETKQ